MDSPKYSIKIHEHCRIAPPSTHSSSLPLSFFDLCWLKFHPVECIIFYPLPPSSHKDPSSYFFNTIVPNLKTSLSLTLQHFLPLTGNIVWPSDSESPIIQYTPNDDEEGYGVSLLIAESDADFNHILDNSSPHEAAESRSFVPHLESSDSVAPVISLQVTLIPKNNGFCIGITTHHAFIDGKSAIMFIKAWASLCSASETESPSLIPELEPFFDRDVIKDPTDLKLFFTNRWKQASKSFSTDEDIKDHGRSLKMLPFFQPKVENSVRAMFELTRADLEKLKRNILSKWDKVDVDGDDGVHPAPALESKPQTLSSYVVTCAYVSVCIAKAIHGVEKQRQKFGFSFTVDYRALLKPPIPLNYFGNCVQGHNVETEPTNYTKEDGVVIVAKKMHHKIKTLDNEVLEELARDLIDKFKVLAMEGVEFIGIVGSNRFGMYGIDFGWGKPSKVDITSVDRGLTFSLIDSKEGGGGIQVGLVLEKNVMDLFETLFRASIDEI